jgi:hypothetical protein
MKTFLTLVLGIILGIGGLLGGAYIYIESKGGAQAIVQDYIKEHGGDALKGQAADKLKDKLGDKIPGSAGGIGDLKSLPKL